jgi:tripartite-type tricarboxylate transporter receptor subunit TctC
LLARRLTRSAALPNVPPLADFIPGFEVSGWQGIGAPKNTPAEIVETLNKAIIHLNGLLFATISGTDLKHVPYTQGSPFNDLLGGHIDMIIDTPNLMIENLKAGRLRALATTGESRLAALPDLPTFAEAGLPAYNPCCGGGLLAPKGTPNMLTGHLVPK